jgi:putative chitinase
MPNTTEMAIASLGANAEKWAYPLETEMLSHDIVHPLEKAHFIAQIAYESNGFTAVEENLNYSAKRLQEVFHKYFPTPKLALDYSRKPQEIANRVYADRMGNGDEASGDGWNFRGRTPIQLTGRANYTWVSLDIFGDLTLVKHPDLAAQPTTGAKICVAFWVKNNCKEPAFHDDIIGVTKRINGGLNGLEGRREWLVKTKHAFGIT